MIHGFGTQLRQVRKAARPAKWDRAARGIGPIALIRKEIALKPLRVIAVGANETDGAARVFPIDLPRVEVRYWRWGVLFRARHQHRQVHAPIGRGLDMSPARGHLRGLEFIAAIPA